MMMKNMKKLSLAVIAISTAMLSTSCLREENFGKADSKFISLKVSTEGIAETKAGHVAEPLEVVDLSQDGLDLFLYGSVKVNKMSPFEPMTKAATPYKNGDESKVEAFDIDMNPIVVEGEELLARALLHEIDHLDGHLYVEKVVGTLKDVNYDEDEE